MGRVETLKTWPSTLCLSQDLQVEKHFIAFYRNILGVESGPLCESATFRVVAVEICGASHPRRRDNHYIGFEERAALLLIGPLRLAMEAPKFSG